LRTADSGLRFGPSSGETLWRTRYNVLRQQ